MNAMSAKLISETKANVDYVPQAIKDAWNKYTEARDVTDFTMQSASKKITRRFNKVYRLCLENKLEPAKVIADLVNS